MSSARYAPLPNAHTDADMNREMEAAFDDEEEYEDAEETQPLNPSPPSPRHARAPSGPGTYDFEAVDYASVPPPGTPPPHNRAFNNNWGNSNGVVPDTDELDAAQLGPSRSWLRRAAASVLPSSTVRRWGLDYEPPSGVVGGGTGNDGVFANVTAKPGRTVEVREGDNIYLMPEDQQLDRPPSYQTAQLDAVPAYWETTVHAPSSTDTFGEMIIDALPSGTLFSFLWNMLISISFQFVGFLLTYLLHTTHAARFGSRAGLGVTLIQYGFALRARDSSSSGGGLTWWGGDLSPNGTDDSVLSHMNFGTKEEAEDFYKQLNITMVDGRPSGHISGTDADNTVDEIQFANDMTTDWLSFFLMTIGWFILLTSVLGFWRVKRWERNILHAQEQNASGRPTPPEGPSVFEQTLTRAGRPFRRFGTMVSEGLGVARNSLSSNGRRRPLSMDENRMAELGITQEQQRELMLARVAHDPVQHQRMQQAFREDDELIASIRAAGML
ncbi:hypothetical protein PENSPDRAFT_630232, partial [Peniophora sp. CONT]